MGPEADKIDAKTSSMQVRNHNEGLPAKAVGACMDTDDMAPESARKAGKGE